MGEGGQMIAAIVIALIVGLFIGLWGLASVGLIIADSYPPEGEND